MTSRKNINIFDFNGVNVAKHWHVAGEVFAISDCLVLHAIQLYFFAQMLEHIIFIPGSVRDENNVLLPAVTLVEQLRMPCGVCKSNDLNDTPLTVNAKCRTLSWLLCTKSY